jgi:amino acid adenylation domain-containing protein
MSQSQSRKDLIDRLLKERGITARSTGITRRGAGDPTPMSFAQERLWFLDQFEPEGAAYNLAGALALSGPLDVSALERALREVVRRHEALRTTFAADGDARLQVIHPEPRIDFAVLDWSARGGESERDVAAQIATEARKPFDLAAGPLVRATLVKLGPEEHVLVHAMHHIVSDVWSMGVLVREVTALYDAFSRGAPSPLPELSVQYADYARFQRAHLAGGALEAGLAYFRQRLAGAPPTLDLPTDRPRPPQQSFDGDVARFHLPAETSAAIRELAKQEGVTLYAFLLAAFSVLLGRYSGQDDIVVGTPTANRTRPEVEPLIGFFVSTLVLRTDLSGAPTFRELLARAKESALGAFAHADVPFERIVEDLQPVRDPSRAPLFQVALALENLGIPELRLPSLTVRPLGAGTKTAKFDLMLTVVDGGGPLTMELEYATALFDASTMDRMGAHFATLLRGIVADPSRTVAALPMLTEAEETAVLALSRGPARDYPLEVPLHLHFEAQVDRTPDAKAVLFDDASLSYAELDARANQLAHHLVALGVTPGSLVGVAMERSLELVIALYATLKAGAAYVPIDPSYPAARVAFFLEDAAPKVLLTQAAVAPLLPVHGATTVAVDAAADVLRGLPTTRLGVSVAPTDAAYMIYTSGSTGQPKGAVNTHEGIVNRLFWMQEAFALEASDVVLQKTPYSFDVSVWELFWPLLFGARLVVAKPDGHKDPELPRQARRERGGDDDALRAVHAARVPGAGRAAAAHLVAPRDLLGRGAHARPRGAPPHAPRGAAAQPVRAHGGCGRRDLVGCDAHRRDGQRAHRQTHREHADPHRRQRVPPVARGVPGELCIGGVQLAQGYWKRPELTAERFVRDPFGGEGARLYKTGDRARWLPNGEIEYLGRIDFQVKLRGFRIELGEIEVALERHAAVKAATVLVREDAPGDQRLVAYVVADPEPAVDELRELLGTSLPDYMVPSAFVFLPAMPLTGSGKVDRRALPAPELGHHADDTRTSPRTPIEEAVARIWSDLLHLPAVGVDDGFFAVGGHSLLATQVIARVRQTLGVEVDIRALFEAPTLAAFARRVEEALRGGGVAVPPLRPAPRGGELPLSFAQERLWFLDQLEPGSSVYNVPAAVRLRGELDVSALGRALDEIIQRHEVLRTTFAAVRGRPVQVIGASASAALPLDDLTGLYPEDRDAAVLARVRAIADVPFDLARGPLLRAKLLRLGPEDHVFVMCMHHVVSDAWTLGVVVHELATLYDAFARGTSSPLPPLPVQYADYAVWQRGYLSGEVLDGQLAYWKTALTGIPDVLDLPSDRSRPPVQTFRGARVGFQLPAELLAALGELSRKEGVTLFMTLYAGLSMLLSRLARQDDVVVGSPIANRTHAETEGLVGFFVNTLVLRTQVDDASTFRAHLARVRSVCLGAYAHQDVPFERLVELLRPERDLSRSPVFQVMVDNMTLPTITKMGSVALEPWGTAVETSRFDLTLALAEKDGGFVASLEYNADLFDASTIERMLGHFAMLLRAGIASPTRTIGELPLLTQSERDQVLLDWNATETAYATDLPIQRLIEAQVARTPDAPALRFEGQTLSYRELDSRANKVARYLQNLGAGPEVRIAVCVERSIEMVVGVLGVLKAGAAYVPMDPAWPADRLGFMLEDTAAPILLAQEKVLDLLPATYVQIVMLDADWAAIEAESDEPVDGGATGESLAYVIYTSGSTGKPKGVLVSHANLVHSTEARLAYYPDKVQSFLLLSSFAFDSSMAGIYWTLIQGGTITLPNEAQKDDPSALAPLVAEAKVSHLLCVPSLYTFLLSQAKDHELESLVAVMVAGEAVPPDTVRRHHERLPAVRLYNEYGPTEATVWCTVHETTLDDGASRVPIGRPIANTAIYLLDKARQPVPAGVPGELYVGGLGITRGYLNRPELNAEKFVANPFGFGPSSTLYRTGDLAKYRENGLIDFLGRIDHQVKIRGYRIELEEIEAVLSTHRNVLEVIVIVREDMPGDQRIVAYVVPADTTPPTNPELKAFLGASLPEYMIPAAFVVLAEMPLLPNGKVDRKALPAPESRAGAAGELVVARTPTEDVLAGIWASVLGSEKVGVQDNFFDLGGHSLLATQVVARINETFHVDLALALLFDLPTVASLAEKLDEIVREGRGMAQPPITVVPRDRELMLSFGQERLWVLDQIEPGNPFYNLPGAVRLDGPLDKDALTAAIQGIGERHELLRTTFGSLAGRPRLVFHETVDLAPEWDDLSHLAEDEQGVAVLARAKEETLRPFDLVKGPLARSLLIKLSEHSHVLVFTLHHIIADGWSMGVMVRELGELYAAKVADRAPDLDPLPVQYADYATWQRQWMRGEVMETQLAYWRQALAGAKTSLDLPTDRPRPAVITYRGARRVYPLGAELSRTLGELCRKEGVTLYMLALAGFGAVLGRYAGQDDVLIGTSVADRRRAETHGLIGYFLNQLVMRVRTNGEPTFAELLLRVREATLGAYAHGDLPFERLVEELRVKPDLSRAPLFQVMVDVANAPGEPLQLPGVTLSAVVPEQTTSRFDLTLSVSEGKDGIVTSIEYSTELFDAATIDRLFGHFANLLARGAANPKAPLASLSLLDEEERNSLLFGWNQTSAEYPDDTPVHVLFEAQVDATPDAIAVVGGDARLTYRELDERANQLANHLVTLGVGPDVLVGLSVRRTPSLLVGLLGILKAGGAYVPIDPSYPIERIAFLLEDSMVPVVISEEAIADTLPTGGLVLRLDADWEEIATQPTDRPAAEVPTESLAYVIYTSGSTGKPKGALITHRGLVNYLWWAKTAYRADEGAGAPVHSSMSFDLTVTGLYLPLLTGKTVILVPEGDEITALADAVRTADGFSLVKLTPAHLELLNHAVPADAARGRVGTFVIGGEALSWGALAFWRQNAPGTRLINEYGPTETVVGCCVYDGALGPDGSGNVPIGRPIANTRLYVLDASMSPVPVGVPGELYIGGDGVARGYWNRDELTAQRFLADPFVPGGRLYKTGDLVRRLPDGVLDFLGRLDHQVKLRGYRIELGEIEAALRADPKVRDVAVLAREDSPGDRRLVAYVVLGEGEQAEAAELRAFVGAALPEYMVPSAVVFLDALPLTDNGKLDRAALPAPELRGTAGPERIAPRTAVEQGLAAIWTDVLGATELSIHDDFFELGGHSLLATQILARVRSTFGVDLPFRTIFESPTIAGLAAHIGERRGENPAPVGAIPRADRSGALSLSFAQERLWFLAALEPESSAYNVAEAVRIQGPLDAAALAAALTGLVARHEVLRTSYPNHEGVAEVRIYAPMPVELPLDDLGGRGASEQRAVVRGVIAEEAQRPFHLATGPLFRARLLRLSAAEHVLCLTMHHIVTDAWSQSVMLREVAALYEAAQRGAPATLPELPLQYVDYAAWQRARLTGEALERELGYWRERLAGMPQALDFPTDRPRPAKQSYAGDKVAFRVPKAVSEGLASLAQREGATLFMTLCAAFATLLQRYSGQDDLAIGTPVANRDQEALEPLVGMFLSTLVLRVDLAEEPSFRTLLGRVRETALGAYAHQGVPFERIVDAVAPERDMSRSPLFQALFTLQNAPQPLATWGGVSIDRLPPEEVAAKVDLALSFAETADGLVGAFEYATALFDAATIERLRDHLQALLRGIVETPELSIGDLPLLAPSELSTVLVDWNATTAAYPREARLFDAFCANARAHGARPALAFRDEIVTYAELDSRSNRLARHLAARGVGVGSLVGLFVERSPAMVVALLAILKAGGAYVPLDPAYPKARIELILKDAKAALLVSDSALASQVDAGAASRVLLDADANAIAAESDAPFDGGATADSVAYAIYTSGSTGTPKGVLVHHRALVNFMASMAKEPGLGEGDRLLAVTSLSFDIAGLELYLPLSVGALVDLADRETQSDGALLAQRLRTTGATVLQATPATFRLLLDAGWAGQPGLVILCGGEAFPRPLADALVPRAKAVWNMFGPTETTIWSTVQPVRAGGASSVPIGRPIANTQLYVVDRLLRPVPIGAPGELCIGGDGVAKGYYERDSLTAERFVAHPLADVVRSFDPTAPLSEKVYRTGDLVRWLADGTVEFLGRLDHQVKLRGYRIELGEIEALLGEHPAVREVVVVAREDGPAKALVAYAALAAGGALSLADMRAHLRDRLPEYMIPSGLVVLEALPRTPNGKLDRRALPKPTFARETTEIVLPRTRTEELLAEAWKSVLGLDTVSIHESFFELGGHSLLAMQLVARIRNAFDIELPVRTIFEAPTLAALAERIDGGHGAAAPSAPIPRVDRGGPLPLSFAQERFWFLAALEPESSAYNVPEAVRIRGPLDVSALEAAIAGLVARHEILRTVYPTSEGKAVVRIHEEVHVPLPVEDLGALDEAAQDAAVRRLLTDEATQLFDLAEGPLFRARLLRLTPESHVLSLTMHHMVTDAWSEAVMLREVAALYDAKLRGALAELPTLSVQYVDYAAWQRALLTGEALEHELGYWRERLAGMPQALDLPTDRPRPPKQSYVGDKVSLRVPKSIAEGLTKLAQREGATLFMALAAAFSALLQRYTGQDDIALGTPVANREREALEPLVGVFLNTLVLRVDLSEEPSFRALLARVRETAFGAYAHQGVPFERVVDALATERDMSRSPLFQVLFTLQNAPQPLSAWGGVTLDRIAPEEVSAKVDLALAFVETEGGLVGTFEYATALFDASTIVRLRDHLLALLRGIVEHPDTSIGALPLLGPSELRTVLVDWNATATPYDRDARLFDAFRRHAARHGGREALVFRDEVFTYAELESRSNRLARHLAARGVGVGSLVGLYVPRSAEMVVALLGILKAGGAYVPLDPAYPKGRIELILADAGASVLVTESALAAEIDAGSAARVLLDGDAARIAAEDDAAFDGGATADSVAYAIYTSGSTGTPKGVLVHHRALVNFLAAMAEKPGFSADDRLLAVTSLSFDIAGLELYLPLSVGGTVDVADQETLTDGALLADRLRTTPASVLQATPATFRLLLDAGWAGQPDLTILCGGEAFPRPLADALVPRAKAVWNMFGPTETTIWSTVQRVEVGGAASVPIGKPIANTELYVVDRALRPVPIGVPGELLIGGEGVAKGLLQTRRAHRRALHRPPALRGRAHPGARGAALREGLSHGRSRALVGGRHRRVPGSPRPPGEAARLSHRARRDRSRARRAPLRPRGGRGAARRRRVEAARRVRRARARRGARLRRGSRAPARAVARVHVALPARRARGPAAHAQRQDRSARAAEARDRARQRGGRAAHVPRRRAAR